ncbi:hypothetical protein GCM10009609_05890 [Pseudonocardia aurantiaca]|uniref:Excalibur calcium-binding domain-containing protein n=1 Tax=Pseudonocardia aurantiaca TaxID=75290 RepID=A0ABW4FJT0_9PSEU
MAVSTRIAAVAAALSAAIVVAMAGTAIAFEDVGCSDFAYQEDAQKLLDQDKSDPHGLDGGPDGPADGVACESLPRRADTTSTSDVVDDTSTTTPTNLRPNTTPSDVPDVDESDVGAVAESGTATPTTPSSSTSPTTVEAPAVDRDCPDFATQADAQVAFVSAPGDPERLDADNDGIACEDQFGTEGNQVAVVPVGGVATGGTPKL